MHVKHKNDSMPSLELLRNRVSYDPINGELTWKPCGVEWFMNLAGWSRLHGKFAGKPVKKRSRGYVIVVITVDGREINARGHRVAWALMTGAYPEQEIDHIDGDRGNNKWSNLRLADHQSNQWNKGPSARNRSGIKGVHKSSHGERWVSQIRLEGKTLHLGSFLTAGEAAQAYQAAAQRGHGEFARSAA